MSDDAWTDDGQPLDYHSRRKHEAERDATEDSDDDGRGGSKTGFNPNDVLQDHPIYRDGEWFNRWEWLNQLDSGRWDNDRPTQNKWATIESDVAFVIHKFEFPDYIEDAIEERTLEILRSVSDEDENALNFGPNTPIELTELAAVSLAARETTDVDEYSEISPSEEQLHDAAVGGDVLEELVQTWVPHGEGRTLDDVRRARMLIRRRW